MNRPLQATVSDDEGMAVLQWTNPQARYDLLQGLRGQRVTVTIEKWRAQRSLSQWGYWNAGPIETLRQAFGYHHDEMLSAIKEQFPSYFLIPGEDGKPDRRRSYKELDTLQFHRLIEEVCAWAMTEHEVYIEPPKRLGERPE